MKYKLIEKASGSEVKPGMRVLSFRNEIFEVLSFDSPNRAGSTGRVNVKPVEGPELKQEQSFYPSVFGLEIVEAPSDPFDN